MKDSKLQGTLSSQCTHAPPRNKPSQLRRFHPARGPAAHQQSTKQIAVVGLAPQIPADPGFCYPRSNVILEVIGWLIVSQERPFKFEQCSISKGDSVWSRPALEKPIDIETPLSASNT